MIGTQLGAYEIREQIGIGGMATVYRAYQANMERFVAIKAIRASILSDQTLRDRFQREARLIARLEHPHLLPIYDFDGDNDPPFIVMRFLEGGTLKQVMATGRLPHSDIIYMLRQVASALDYAHRQGIVHRDLKPSNIMIDREGNAFIADFGIARITESTEDLTGTGMLIGTPGYMAPEQARGESDVDHRADIYSLGATVFEMLAGQQPYQSDSNLGVIMAHVNNPIPSITEIDTALPPAVDGVIRKALAKEREQRYATAGSLVEELAVALEVKEAGLPAHLQSMTETISRDQLLAFEASQIKKETGVDTPSDQQRQMSAVYIDVTELAEMLYEKGLETESVRADMEALWKQFDQIVRKHEGVIQSHTDEVGVALWGMERAREDDAEQAIRAALDMRTATTELTRKALGKNWEPSEETPLPFLSGITTGAVLLERNSDTATLTASGATITVAGRLKEAAPPGSILVDHDTFTQVRGVFTFQEHQPLRVRGRKELLDVYLAVRAKPRAFRTQIRGIEGVETRMIGREIELRLLQEALTLTIEDGETQVVTVVGDAGVGKSRLLYEFTNWIDLLEDTLWFFEARATQPSMLQPFSLTRDLFSFRFQILDSDPLEVVHERFVKGVEDFMGDSGTEKAPMIGQLVGFDFSSYPAVSAALQDPDHFQTDALSYLGEFFVTASKRNPIFIQIEDIHWADDRSLDLINNLVSKNTQLPFFVICMSRPSLFERRPQWGEGQRFHARVHLEPLSLLSSRRLVKELLKKATDVPSALRDLIIDRAEGNPFYIEELIKALIDDRVIVKADEEWTIDESRLDGVRIPPTLTGVLQSRLDTLPTALQHALQRASVVGRVFWDAALVQLSETEGVTETAITAMLQDLREREMVLLREETGFAGSGEYVFRHAILRDVTYETIVPRQRRTYHKLVGDWLISVGGERAEEHTLLVAEHYDKAGEVSLAADQLAKAGIAALIQGATIEAISLYERAIALLNGDEHQAQRLDLRVKIGEAFALKADFASARKYLEPALDEARAAGETRAQAKALAQLARITGIWQGDLETAHKQLTEALPLARELNDPEVLIFILRQMGSTVMTVGDEDPVPYLIESIELAREHDAPISVAAALNTLAICKEIAGNHEEAGKLYDESLQIFREMGNRFGVAMVLTNLAERYLIENDSQKAQTMLDEGLLIAKEIGNEGMMMGYSSLQAKILAQEDKLEEARAHHMDSLHRARTLENRVGYLDGTFVEGYLRYKAGDSIGALELMALVITHQGTEPVLRLTAEELKAKLVAAMSKEEAEAAIARGEKLDLDMVIAEIFEEGGAS
jgi:serine/threonine protein kinase/tetratricopeptide (TPR) repeat protein